MGKDREINPDRDTILIGFKYDEATEIVFDWITDITFLSALPNNCLFSYHNGTLDEQEKLTSQLKQLKNGVVEIFCGHGSTSALLGPSPNSSEKHYNFYHTDMVSELPGSLFAFSCYSAEFFGWFYSCAGKNKMFLGFTKEIRLSREDAINLEVKKIFHDVAIAVVNTGKITEEHRGLFINSISKLIKDIEDKKISCKAPLTALSIINNYRKCFTKH